MVLDPEKIHIEIFLYHGLLCKGLGYYSLFEYHAYTPQLSDPLS